MKEAESDAVKLGERLREVNRALEEEKNKNAVLTARLEVLARAAASAGVVLVVLVTLALLALLGVWECVCAGRGAEPGGA